MEVRGKERKERVIVNTLCLIIPDVLFSLCVPLLFGRPLFCYGPVDKRTNRQTFGLAVNIAF